MWPLVISGHLLQQMIFPKIELNFPSQESESFVSKSPLVIQWGWQGGGVDMRVEAWEVRDRRDMGRIWEG